MPDVLHSPCYGAWSGEREAVLKYSELSREQLLALYETLSASYETYRRAGLSLDLSRGKPCAEQLDLSLGLLSRNRTAADCKSEGGIDCRNYGLAYGLPEMKRFFSEITGVDEERIIVGGNSSLTMMFDTVMRAMLYGVVGSPRPWCREEHLRFLCPAPGYDRHFAICESLGMEMIPITMTEVGPDMDEVESYVKDPAVKGIWCVPKYSNPTGITYSDETVIRLAKMETAAPDFRIFWDNAYVVHDLGNTTDPLLDIFAAAKEYGHENRIFYYPSTTKITFPGAGVAMMAASEENLAQIKPILSVQTIGPDKLNQLRHIEFLRDREGVRRQMAQHAAILRRKFDILLSALSQMEGEGIASWTNPRGGYFVSLDVMEGCARRVYALCRDAGVTLTSVGATFPYGRDPHDRNLRLAPSYPSDEDLSKASEVLVCAVRLAAAEKLLHEKKI